MIDFEILNDELQKKDSRLNIEVNNLIRHFYYRLLKFGGSNEVLFEKWKEDFTYSYGDITNNNSSNNRIKSEILSQKYDIKGELNVMYLFMSIQTFLSLFIRLIAFISLKSFKNELLPPKITKTIFMDINNGKVFRNNAILNYCYVDWYSWFIEDWDVETEDYVNNLYNSIRLYDVIGNEVNLYKDDHIKNIYEAIIPHELRHALGEFYTPDWLAEYTIKETIDSSKKEFVETSFLDPTCGSGTFIFKTIQLLREENQDVHDILNNVKGFDVNQLAVLTAKTNYFLSIIDKIDFQSDITFPIFNVDVFKIPEIKNKYIEVVLNTDDVIKIPEELIYNQTLYHLLSEIPNLSNNDIEIYLINILQYDDNVASNIARFFNQFSNVGKEIIINMLVNRIEAFKVGKVDSVIGNPPWVNWEYLPEQYRLETQHLWTAYSLFSAKGRDLSFSKEDISVLITYLVIDKFLKPMGVLGFVLRQGLFKGKQNGVGFRRFKFKDEEIKVLHVDDLSKFQSFEGVTNSTAVLFLKKGEKNTYPVKYNVWEKTGKGKRIKQNESLQEVKEMIRIDEQYAKPSVEGDKTSVWATGTEEELKIIDLILGSNEYSARTGVFTGGANAIYLMDIISKKDNGNIIIRNHIARAKRKVPQVEKEIEPNLIYPLLRGSDVKQWSANPSLYILNPHTKETKMNPIEEENFIEKFPLTYSYLSDFKDILDERKGFAGWEKEIQNKYFYSILRIGEYTFSKYKVAWKYIATDFTAAVVGSKSDLYLGDTIILPNEKIMYISTESELEAYYLCGILTSTPVALTVKSYMNPTSISTHVLSKLRIPTFDENNILHQEIGRLCKLGHEAENDGIKEELLNQIDIMVKKIYV